VDLPQVRPHVENVTIVDQGALTNLGGQGGCLATGTWATTFNLVHYYTY
jgi:hypothetical protein